jgi:hypothetical protein
LDFWIGGYVGQGFNRKDPTSPRLRWAGLKDHRELCPQISPIDADLFMRKTGIEEIQGIETGGYTHFVSIGK